MDETGVLGAQDVSARGGPVSRAPWRPLLSGEVARRAREAAGALAAGLDPADAAGPGQGSLASGAAGLAVCHAMLARAGEGREAAARASACLDEAIGWLAAGPVDASLYSGFTGVAWAARLVDGLLAARPEDRNEAVDRALTSLLGRRHLAEQVPYDLISGLTGHGVYALASLPRAAGVQHLAAVIEQLGRRARRDSDGVYWWTPPSLLFGPKRRAYPHGGVDLGVAHGIAGVLPLLARAQALGVAAELAGPLLHGAVSWLLAHLADTKSGLTVPGFVTAGTEPEPCRCAWCYGDPGVAAALLLAAGDAGRADWAEIATGLALRAAARHPQQTGVMDAGLCHGTAGLAHLFGRMYQLTGEPELASAAVTWAGRTLACCTEADAADPGSAAPPWKGPGLLEGAAGVALCLLAASTATEPVWDQALLVATAGQAGVCR